jgi:uncharacterized membrane protein
MRSAIGWAWKALVVLACIAYQTGVHVSLSNAQPDLLRTILLWLPLAVLAGWILARSKHKPLWLAALLAAGMFVYLVEHEERLGLAAVSGIPHAAAYLFLLWYFGRTLARGREPLISRFARSVHGALDPEMALFTRKVTIAWCLFFAVQLIASALLFGFAPLSAWSLFINLLNLPLVALMFVGQFAYRMIRYPDYPRVSLWQAIQVFIKDTSRSKSAEVR